MAIAIETVRTERFSMDYFRFGHGEEMFVILPGLSIQSVMRFADIVAHAYRSFTDDYTVFVFDRRKELPLSYSVHEMAQDTAEVFRVLGLDRVNLFGASQGGMIAMEIAIGYPDIVRKLILGSVSARVDEAQTLAVENWIRLAKAGEKEALFLAFGEAVYPKDMFERSRNLLTGAAKAVTGDDLKRLIVLAEGVKGFDVLNDLEKIACPVLLLGSADDHVLGANASIRIAERLGGRDDFECHMYEGYGHAAYDTAPDYKERILHFLSKG